MRGSAQHNELKILLKLYSQVKATIEARLNEFQQMWAEADDKDAFRELVFCLFTPQSKAKSCWAAVERIGDMNIIYDGTAEQVSCQLKGVRFHHTKAARVVKARKFLPGLKNRIDNFKSPEEAREWLVQNVDGMSYKEASHFLRNIGKGRDLAILDRHILKNLLLLGVISEVPSSLSPKKYLEIESGLRDFCLEANIPMDHLDMLLWCRETGEVFK